jgi:predicted secreted protein with PEFG-CTERM motif
LVVVVEIHPGIVVAPAWHCSVGTIATLTFNVTSTGPTGLGLQTELADHPAAGENSNFIDHQDTVDSVTAVIPEFPSTTILALFIALATAAIILTAKQLNKNKVASNQKESYSNNPLT